MTKTLGVLAGLIGLTACSVFQGSYDAEARAQCRDLPTIDERVACERAADDAARTRRQDQLD